jgi:hypothetical protein
MVAHVRYSVAGQSRGRVALCTVCTMHMETRSADFLVEPQNQGLRFVSGLISKSLGRFLRFDLKIGGDGFLVYASKSSKLRFINCATKPIGGCDDVGHTLGFPVLP